MVGVRGAEKCDPNSPDFLPGFRPDSNGLLQSFRLSFRPVLLWALLPAALQVLQPPARPLSADPRNCSVPRSRILSSTGGPGSRAHTNPADLPPLMNRGSPNREGRGSLASQGVQSELRTGKQSLPSAQPALSVCPGSADAAGEIKTTFPISL